MTKGQMLLAVVRCCFGIALVFFLRRKVSEFVAVATGFYDFHRLLLFAFSLL